MGHVCHHDIANDTDTDANKVIVEAAVRATRSSSLAAGDVVYLTSSAMINDQILAVTQVNLSLVLTEDFNETDHDTVIKLISPSRGKFHPHMCIVCRDSSVHARATALVA